MGDTAAAGAEAAIQGAAQGFAQGGPIGAAIGAVTDLIGSLLTTSLSGKQKQSTTAIANDAEVLMQQNLSAYLASRAPRRTRRRHSRTTISFGIGS